MCLNFIKNLIKLTLMKQKPRNSQAVINIPNIKKVAIQNSWQMVVNLENKKAETYVSTFHLYTRWDLNQKNSIEFYFVIKKTNLIK